MMNFYFQRFILSRILSNVRRYFWESAPLFTVVKTWIARGCTITQLLNVPEDQNPPQPKRSFKKPTKPL